MRPRVRRAGALVIASLLAVPLASAPQTASSGAGLAGDWAGWATLTNDWPGHPCRYEGSKDETSVRLELSSEEGRLQGSAAIDLPSPEGSGCPPLRKRLLITEVVLAEGVVSLTDSGGHDWDLSLRGNGRSLRGIMAWQQGGADEPLAQGFAFSDGTKPRSRLSGEVQLRRATAPTGAAEEGVEAAEGTADPEASATSKRTTGGGTYVKHVGAILGATAVGLGALYGANKLGQGGTEEGVVTCSPRRCVVGAPGEPCFCEGNVVSGEDCGDTETGIPIGGNCDYPTMPCEALLSCNSGICEDRFGRCPFS
jgi:hypothetical protein